MEKGVTVSQGMGKRAKVLERLPGGAGTLMLQPCPVFTLAHLGTSFSHILQLPIVFASFLKFPILCDLYPESERGKFIKCFYVLM